MYNNDLYFDREIKFTRAYKENINEDKATRELACLKVQIPTSFKKIKNDDIIAGRISGQLVGFYSIFGGNLGIDKEGYCINEDMCNKQLARMKEQGVYTDSYIKEIEDMIAFWHTESTVERTKAKFTPEMIKSLCGDDYNSEVGAAFPLYRIAGMHINANKILTLGLNGLIESIENMKLEKPESVKLYDAMIGTIELIKDVCTLYIEDINNMIVAEPFSSRKKELQKIATSLKTIRDDKPKTLQDAIQLITIYSLANGNRDIGRLDDYFCEFYKHDIENGIITRDEAVKLVVAFFDIIEQEFFRDTRAIIGGMGRRFEHDADEFALVVLDALEKRPYNYLPQVSLRYYKAMDQRLYDKSLDILSHGLTFPILYNDDVNVNSTMKSMNVSREVAEQYAFFGCGEYMLSGKSIGTPNVLLNIPKILEVTLHNGKDFVSGKEIGLKTGEMTDDMTFEEFYEKFSKQMNYFADLAGSFSELVYDADNEQSSWLTASIAYDDCIARGKALFDGGIEHLGATVETYGNITTANSITAIKEIVFEQKKFSITKLIEMLDKNFEGFDVERGMLLNADRYGNDNDNADKIAVKVHETVCNSIRRQSERTRLDSFLVVVINNNMNISMGRITGATADGRLAGEFLSNGNNAYNGEDKEGITALMKSLTKLSTDIHAGASQMFKFSTELFEHREKIKALLSGYFDLGGQHTNISVINQKDLEDAMINPDAHENLVVRVGGYTARFVFLDKKTQLEVLSRTAY